MDMIVYKLEYYVKFNNMFKGKTRQEMNNECSDFGALTYRRTAHESNSKLARMCLDNYFSQYEEDDDGIAWIALYRDGEYYGQFRFDYSIEMPDPSPDVSLTYIAYMGVKE